DVGQNFEGHNILFVPLPPEEVASNLGISALRLAELVARARAVLYQVREGRVHPSLDDKVLASWNGLVLAALAETGRALDRRGYGGAAVATAGFLAPARVGGGRVPRSWRGGRAKIRGYLGASALVGRGLAALSEATFDRQWLDESRRLCEEALRLFWDA